MEFLNHGVLDTDNLIAFLRYDFQKNNLQTKPQELLILNSVMDSDFKIRHILKSYNLSDLKPTVDWCAFYARNIGRIVKHIESRQDEWHANANPLYKVAIEKHCALLKRHVDAWNAVSGKKEVIRYRHPHSWTLRISIKCEGRKKGKYRTYEYDRATTVRDIFTKIDAFLLKMARKDLLEREVVKGEDVRALYSLQFKHFHLSKKFFKYQREGDLADRSFDEAYLSEAKRGGFRKIRVKMAPA